MPPLQHSFVRADHPHPLSILLQGRGEPPLLCSTVHAYVPLISALILRTVVPLCQPSDETAPFTFSFKPSFFNKT